MTTGRPYRGARMELDAALAEIARCSGKQFDPQVCIAFDRAVRDGLITLPPIGLPTPRSVAAIGSA